MFIENAKANKNTLHSFSLCFIVVFVWITQIISILPLVIMSFTLPREMEGFIFFGVFFYYFGAIMIGCSTYFYCGAYLRNIEDQYYFSRIKKIDNFKIFLNAISFHYYRLKHRNKIETSREKATFAVKSKDLSSEFNNPISCGNLLSLVEFGVNLEYADQETKLAYEHLNEQLRKRNVSKDEHFIIETEYDFPNYKKYVLIRNANCLPLLNFCCWIIFTFIIPLGAIYFTYFAIVVSRKEYSVTKLISLDNQYANNFNGNFEASNNYNYQNNLDYNNSSINAIQLVNQNDIHVQGSAPLI